MDIRELSQKSFNVTLPISGGIGNSIETAVIIHSHGMLNNYIQNEYDIMDNMAACRACP